MLDLERYKDLVYKIIGAAMEVHNELGWGLLEPIYQECLSLELSDMEISHAREVELLCKYKEHTLEKRYRMDFVVGDIILELKSVTELTADHRSQLCNYLRISKKPMGLLINFGQDHLIGERWAYDIETNECYIVDRNMQPVFYTTRKY